jgi:hypothetical protein
LAVAGARPGNANGAHRTTLRRSTGIHHAMPHGPFSRSPSPRPCGPRAGAARLRVALGAGTGRSVY